MEGKRSIADAVSTSSPWVVNWVVFLVSLGLFVCGGALTWAWMRARNRAAIATLRNLNDNSKGLPGAASWKFGDSWASNLTALVAAIVAISTVFTSASANFFDANAVLTVTVVSAGALIMAATAPILYATGQHYLSSQHDPQQRSDRLGGSANGLLFACTATVASVYAQVGAIAALMYYSDSIKLLAAIIVSLLLTLLTTLVHMYAIRSVGWVFDDALLPQGTATAVEGIISLNYDRVVATHLRRIGAEGASDAADGPSRRLSLL
jgi:hypothetical protein